MYEKKISHIMTERPARTILSYFKLELSCKALIPLFDPLAKEEAAKGKKETTDKALGKKKWQFHLIVLDFIKILNISFELLNFVIY